MKCDMSHNLEYLLTRPGGLKIATVIFGIVGCILSGHSYGASPYTDYYSDELKLRNNTLRLPGTELELYNMSSTFVFCGLSLLYLVAHALFYFICESRLNKFIDTAFHMAGALLLFAGGTTVIYSSVHIEQYGCPSFEKVANGTVSKGKFMQLEGISTLLIGSRNGDKEKICHYFGEKIVAGSFNIFNAILYGFLGFVIFTTELDEI